VKLGEDTNEQIDEALTGLSTTNPALSKVLDYCKPLLHAIVRIILIVLPLYEAAFKTIATFYRLAPRYVLPSGTSSKRSFRPRRLIVRITSQNMYAGT
jgi:hypothetical protein